MLLAAKRLRNDVANRGRGIFSKRQSSQDLARNRISLYYIMRVQKVTSNKMRHTKGVAF